MAVDRQVKTVVFDWGGTLMKVLPYSGIMADWPEVAAVDEVNAALAELSDQVRLVVATNAIDSNAEQVRAALARVGLADYFDAVYTYAQLGWRKPETGFFLALERELGLSRYELAMVGDEYGNDILGASKAGWMSVWYNPLHRLAPGLAPQQTADIHRMKDLPAVFQNEPLPDYSSCMSLHQRQNASRNLINHIEMVAAGAYALAVWLRAAGLAVDPLLAHRGGLLHDIAKILENEEGPDHAQIGAGMLRQQGQAALAEIIDRHMLFNVLFEERRPQTWEQKLVYFADKVVEGAQFVPVERRIERLQSRYGIEPEWIEKIVPALHEMQAELCRALGWQPAEMIENLQQAARAVNGR